MTIQYAIIRLHRTDGWNYLAAWWSADVMVAVEEDFIWARFGANNKQLSQQALRMPAERFRLVDHWLVREGQKIADAELPALQWQPIDTVLKLQLPWIGSAGQAAQLKSTTWQLMRGGAESTIAGAMIDWPLLTHWVDTAAQWRLNELRYCVAQQDAKSMALVLGSPLPPLEAQYLVARQNILIPAGMQWLPAMDPDSVKRSFGVSADQWLLWRTSDEWYVLDDQLLVPLTRASVRMLLSEQS